ncbi:Sulfhydryl oxidase [Caenorhabditis elegans]|uniref:Sulfhydryl oxidase n=1 Tax=Caenorhabditis elegans TaxID=6239 RepID=P91442_CAEEL|nr:Sulfhydryl oxidase [Caenorhabditis elegans]CCD61191.1 Sulfhydryl oxidase [Caenorhabditis elegans]|eukprot:NP_508419.1 Sulfhydryl oxidase [Caenorhabditis elegans]
MFLLILLITPVLADIATYGYHPKGANPTLYSPEDSVLQLDEATFNDTIFGAQSGAAGYLVEFYSDWCGHCRAFAPTYKNLAKDVDGWQNIVKIAAINCADPVNEPVCRSNGVRFFPLIKYFPRDSLNSTEGSQIKPYSTVSEMRGQLTKAVMDDYALNRYPEWPTFDFLKDVVTYGELWNESSSSANHIAIIFETNQASLTGAQLLLDLSGNRDRLVARRCLKSHPLAEALKITDFPSLAIFKRGERKPVLIAELRRLLLREIDQFLGKPTDNHLQTIHFSSRKNKTIDCNKNPELCKPNYFVSEVDMLKAMRYALFRESARTGAPLQAANLSALYEFTSLLADTFPTTTIEGASDNSTVLHLDRSSRAVRVFSRLRDFIAEKGLEAPISVEDWQKEFLAAEEEAGHPFPLNTNWEHCAGSSTQYRGYTCGLWTTFHALTVSAFKNWQNKTNDITLPLPPLQSIRDWVGSFFGCNHCRDHFLKMTTDTFKIEANVRRPEDVYLYLWKAHNKVNARLHGRETEDPKFPKYQFPAKFLCVDCNAKGFLNEDDTQPFLIDYYSRIRPFTNSTLIKSN